MLEASRDKGTGNQDRGLAARDGDHRWDSKVGPGAENNIGLPAFADRDASVAYSVDALGPPSGLRETSSSDRAIAV